MPVDETVNTNEHSLNLQEEVERLTQENERLNKALGQAQHELELQNLRYGKLFGLFANTVDYYLGSK